MGKKDAYKPLKGAVASAAVNKPIRKIKRPPANEEKARLKQEERERKAALKAAQAKEREAIARMRAHKLAREKEEKREATLIRQKWSRAGGAMEVLLGAVRDNMVSPQPRLHAFFSPLAATAGAVAALAGAQTVKTSHVGSAAANVDGITVCSLLSLRSTNADGSLKPLGEEALRDARLRFCVGAGPCLVILDEWSTVGLLDLGQIVQRLREIFGRHVWQVVLQVCGDHIQIQAVQKFPTIPLGCMALAAKYRAMAEAEARAPGAAPAAGGGGGGAAAGPPPPPPPPPGTSAKGGAGGKRRPSAKEAAAQALVDTYVASIAAVGGGGAAAPPPLPPPPPPGTSVKGGAGGKRGTRAKEAAARALVDTYVASVGGGALPTLGPATGGAAATTSCAPVPSSTAPPPLPHKEAARETAKAAKAIAAVSSWKGANMKKAAERTPTPRKARHTLQERKRSTEEREIAEAQQHAALEQQRCSLVPKRVEIVLKKWRKDVILSGKSRGLNSPPFGPSGPCCLVAPYCSQCYYWDCVIQIGGGPPGWGPHQHCPCDEHTEEERDYLIARSKQGTR